MSTDISEFSPPSPLRDLAEFPQTGHDNWIRAIIFHPTGKYLLSASDDKTIRIWDLATGRCLKTVDAHGHFVTCMTWGRTAMGGSNGEGKVVNGDAGTSGVRRVNVLATGSVDQTVKVSWIYGSCPGGHSAYRARYGHLDDQQGDLLGYLIA